MRRRDFLKTTGLAAGSLALGLPAPARAAAQKFEIGMAATLWLQADAATETYWKACQVISSLGFRTTEADNTLAISTPPSAATPPVSSNGRPSTR